MSVDIESSYQKNVEGRNVDPRYEFCAPQYIDFTTLNDPAQNNDNADEWFTASANQGMRTPLQYKSPKPSRFVSMADLKSPELEPTGEAIADAASPPASPTALAPAQPAAPEESLSKPGPQDLPTATSKADAGHAARSFAKGSKTPRPASKPAAACRALASCHRVAGAKMSSTAKPAGKVVSKALKKPSVRGARKCTPSGPASSSCAGDGGRGSARRAPLRPPSARTRPPASAQPSARRAPPPEPRRAARVATQSLASSKRSLAADANARPNKSAKLTVPASPKLSKAPPRVRSSSMMSSEDLLLQRVKLEMEEQAQKRLALRSNVSRLLKAPPPVLKRSDRALTVPKEFGKLTKSVASARKSNMMSTEDMLLHKAKQEAAELAQKRLALRRSVKRVLKVPPPTVSRSAKTLTMPQEFGLASRKRKHVMTLRSDAASETPRSPYVPLAERLLKYQKTPQRWRRSKTGQSPDLPERLDPAAPLTVPQSPRFSTQMRARPSSHKPWQEREAELMASMPSFKARKMDQRVMDSCGDLGVPRVVPAPLTDFAPFNLGTDKRAAAYPDAVAKVHNDWAKEETFAPKTTHLNKAILAGATFEAKRPHHKLEVPASPALATRTRSAVRPATTEAKDPPPALFKARDLPDHSRVSVPRKAAASGPTHQEPFTLCTDLRGEAKTRQQKQLLEAEEAMQYRAFVAKDMPRSTIHHVEKKRPAPPITAIEPFPLLGMDRHECAVQEMQRKVEAEEQRKQEEMEFKARPLPKTHTHPTEIVPKPAPLCSVQNIVLSSDRRATKRAEFDEKIAQKQSEAELMRQQQEAEFAIQEAQAIKEMRRQMVPKARRLPKSRPFLLKRSQAALTIPLSPAFSTRSKSGVASSSTTVRRGSTLRAMR